MPKIVGIDLGTTNSLVAVMEGGRPRILPGPGGRRLLPSIVAFDGGRETMGEDARRRLATHPADVIYSVKRFMGRGLADLQEELKFFPFHLMEEPPGVVRIEIAGRRFTPPEISALILGELKRWAEADLGESVSQAVITVPAYFNDSQRQATKDAGRIAGLEVLRIVNEPTAASLAYGLHQRKEGLIAVYDLGGGTFDISILKLQGGIFEVLATNGDTHLGGDDMDRRLAEWLAGQMSGTRRAKAAQADGWSAVRLAAEAAKCALSSDERTVVEIALPGEPGIDRIPLTRAQLESLMMPIVERTLDPCRLALRDAGVSPDRIDEVVLVGGMTRMPLIRRRVEELFGRRAHTELNPDEVVALGAAVQADILAGGTRDLLLLDVNPLSLGIETLGGVMSVLIPRNTTIPTSAKESFTTSVDGQRTVDIHVLQGERELVADNRSLARFQLREIDPMPAGLPKIELTFMIDANGILSVSAKELRSHKEQSIEVKPSYGLTEDEVTRMVEASYLHAKDDIARRNLIEARNEAEMVLRATGKALADAGGLLAQAERTAIEAAAAELRDAVRGEEPLRIRERIKRLDETTVHLAGVLLGRTIQHVAEQQTERS
ncbi:MAG: molecular chaperone DnaK [Nitrospirae bacterium]|nr:molecular chaperone DnaK [Nitrospirota bacterium]